MLRARLQRWKRRPAFRVAAAYLVAAWGVLQAGEALVPLLSLPDWTVLLLATLLGLGLPVTLVVGWSLQSAQSVQAVHGADGTDTGDGESAPQPWLDLALLLAIVVMVAVTAVQVLGSRRPEPAAPVQAPGLASVVVLPFASFSDDPADGYFADGLTEELIHGLAQLDGLQVSGRTSSFHFKGRNEDLRSIGQQLGVAHVLEGSVRRDGDRLRVTAQLVSAADGFHLWSQVYDRGLSDVLGVQNDIATKVAAALKVTLLNDPGTAPDPGANRVADAAASFLVATAQLRERNLDDITQARERFAALLDDNPDDVGALAGFARSSMVLASAYLTVDFESAARESEAAVKHALTLAPDDVRANLAAGMVYRTRGLRSDDLHYLALARRALARAVESAPSDPDALLAYGGLLAQLGDWERALPVIERGVELDPLHPAARVQLAEAQRGVGRIGEAQETLESVLDAAPGYLAADLELGELFMETGALEAAAPHLYRAHAARQSPRASFALAQLYLNLEMPDALEHTLDEFDYAPLSLPLAAMVRFMAAEDFPGALALAERELDRTGDPIWRPLAVLTALVCGDVERARAQLRILEPALLAPRPVMAGVAPATVLLAAGVLLQEGRPEAARELLEPLLESLSPPDGGFDPVARKILRAEALAGLGRGDEAMAELVDARRQGYRTLYDFDNFLRLDRYPTMAGLRQRADFSGLIEAIAADNRAAGRRLRAASA